MMFTTTDELTVNTSRNITVASNMFGDQPIGLMEVPVV